MIIHLIYNKQLKVPLKRVPPNAYVMINAGGAVMPAIVIADTPAFVKGKMLATFDVEAAVVAPQLLVTVAGFKELLGYLSKYFLPTVTAEMVLQLVSSQSLTIAHVAKQLNIPRASAKEFVEKCVKYGAYKKYYSYWVRTDIFTSWIAQREGG